MRTIIVAGDLYSDIDVLACAVSYQELLKLQYRDSLVVLPGPFNKSITEKVANWNFLYEKSYSPFKDDVFVIVDISEPLHIAKFVDQDKIIKLYDHHYGFEEYWESRYGNDAIIEKVGACATIIWEEFHNLGLDNSISTTSANLLLTAIISNTLNFKASVTTSRDIDAYKALLRKSDLPENWIEEYFSDQDEFAYKYPYEAVKGDTIVISTELPYKLTIGQLELWNSKSFFTYNLKEAVKALKSFGSEYWFFTSPSISEDKNYIYTESKEVQSLLQDVLNITFKENMAVTKNLILRKEIKKLIFEKFS